ncbi:MAG: N-acetyltransferase [Ekhidna sp.]|nr:N-acetyltransferase [Ekhidna sp.]
MRIIDSGLKDVDADSSVTIIMPSNLYGCTLAKNVFVGPFVEIQKKVTIGARTKIQSHSFICELVEIGEDCFIGHGVMFINDVFSSGGPSGGDSSKWKKTSIGNKVSIGSNATMMPVNVCDNVVIGAGSVVTKDITEPGVYAGNPARKLRDL